ncbi:MAG: DUF4149 domain-containing protein [Candidatus Brocadiia bacterium]|nr:MAG: DUF4149 domain-containing protein [Candidatus Brocadiia bacterium]
MKTGSIFYSFILALWIGGLFIFTFLVTPVVFQSFGRDAAGEIIGKLFPYYFPYNLVLSVLALIIFLLFIGIRGKSQNKIMLLLLTAAVLINMFITFKLYPDIQSVKQQITTFETQTDESPVRNQFRKMHGLSALLNILLLLDGTALLILNSTPKK